MTAAELVGERFTSDPTWPEPPEIGRERGSPAGLEPATLSVWSAGAAHPVTVSAEPLFDPANERLKDVAAPAATS